MKIIDLLNRIANGEKVPKKFKIKGSCFKDLYFEYNEKYDCYDLIGENFKEGCYVFGYSELNDEVEIIEEDKKIEKIDLILDEQFSNDELQAYIKETQEKVNEIIDKINEE